MRGFTHSKLFIGLLALSLGLSGCSFKKGEKNEETQENSGPSAKDIADEINRKDQERAKGEVLTAEDFQFLVTPQKRPNEYLLTINYTQKPGVKIFVLKNEIPMEDASSGQEIPVDGGAVLNFKISIYNSLSQLITTFSKTIKVPLDFVISEKMVLNQDLAADYGRLVFTENSLLKTNGHLVSITADQLIANANSRIINFESQDQGTEARHQTGGSITIRAQEASGFLRVNLQGTQGIAGRSGDELTKIKGPKPPVHGHDGHDAVADWNSDCNEGKSCGTFNHRCITPAENGEDGEPGGAGYDGEAGQTGGDAGNFFIQIEDNKAFSLLFSAKPGVGGRGGQGGEGFEGGLGGEPGKSDPVKACPQAKKGTDGAKGPKGANGKEGAPGKDGSYLFNGLQNLILDK